MTRPLNTRVNRTERIVEWTLAAVAFGFGLLLAAQFLAVLMVPFYAPIYLETI